MMPVVTMAGSMLVFEGMVPAFLGNVSKGMIGCNTTVVCRCGTLRGIQIEYLEGYQDQQQVYDIFKTVVQRVDRVLKRKTKNNYCPNVF